jgi:hypothetical protein
MLNTYIKNRGITKTIIHDNKKSHVNLVNWDADFDGDIANISVSSNMDGIKKQFDIQLDKEDLDEILNIPSVEMPLEKRLQLDFQQENPNPNPKHYLIELPTFKLDRDSSYRHISSPKSNEELIIPFTFDRKSLGNYYITPRRNNRRKKSHITHRVYKKSKSRNHKSRSKSTSKTSSKTRSFRR